MNMRAPSRLILEIQEYSKKINITYQILLPLQADQMKKQKR